MKKKIALGIILMLISLIFTIVAIPTSMGAAPAITLTPTSQARGASFSISGTGFGATKAVGIGFGAEVNVTNETMSIAGPYDVANGSYTGLTSHIPIKPGTFRMSINASNTIFAAVSPDLGNGSLGDPLSIFINGTINYVAGQYTRFTKTPVASTAHFVHLVNYTRYQYDLTPTAGVITDSSGSFTAKITVPNLSNGNYVITAIDSSGNIATSILNVAGGNPPLAATAFCNVTVLSGWTWYFFVHSNGGVGAHTYQWYEGSTMLQGQTSMVLSVTKNTPGTYTFYCKVTDSQGTAINSNAVYLTVK